MCLIIVVSLGTSLLTDQMQQDIYKKGCDLLEFDINNDPALGQPAGQGLALFVLILIQKGLYESDKTKVHMRRTCSWSACDAAIGGKDRIDT